MCKDSCNLHLQLLHRVQNQLICGQAVTAWCHLLSAAVIQFQLVSVARLCGAGSTIRCPQNEISRFITLPSDSCLPGIHIPAKGDMRRPSSCLDREGEESHPPQGCRASSQVCWVYSMEICQQSTLLTKFN